MNLEQAQLAMSALNRIQSDLNDIAGISGLDSDELRSLKNGVGHAMATLFEHLVLPVARAFPETVQEEYRPIIFEGRASREFRRDEPT